MDENELLLIGIASEQFKQRQFFAASAEGRPAGRQRLPGRMTVMSDGKTGNGRGCCSGRGSGGAQQVVRYEAMAALSIVSDKSSDLPSQLLIGRLLPGRGIDGAGGGVATRQFQRHNRPGVADHHVAHQITQPLRVSRLTRLARGHVR
jgi:hypothetical protein